MRWKAWSTCRTYGANCQQTDGRLPLPFHIEKSPASKLASISASRWNMAARLDQLVCSFILKSVFGFDQTCRPSLRKEEFHREIPGATTVSLRTSYNVPRANCRPGRSDLFKTSKDAPPATGRPRPERKTKIRSRKIFWSRIWTRIRLNTENKLGFCGL